MTLDEARAEEDRLLKEWMMASSESDEIYGKVLELQHELADACLRTGLARKKFLAAADLCKRLEKEEA